MNPSLTDVTRERYARYAAAKGADRNDLMRNPQVLFQTLASRAAFIRAIASIPMQFDTATALDVGCGSAPGLLTLIECGFRAANLYGIELMEERFRAACDRLLGAHFFCGDASAMPFPDGEFDICCSHGLFLQITDDSVRNNIAREMIRVTRKGGHILVADWRYTQPGNKDYKAVSRRYLAEMFRIGKSTAMHGTFMGALVPPVGRFLSKHCSPLYFLVHRLFPFLVGYTVTVLTKL